MIVADAQAALQELARIVLIRRRTMLRRNRVRPLTVVAVTGSAGQDQRQGHAGPGAGGRRPTVATAGSFNNELGLPLTVLRVTAETRYLVLEMGARGVGHLRDLCHVAPPDVSLVLNVGKAHIGEFGSQAAIAQAKGEIVEALPNDGTAVLNADDAARRRHGGAHRRPGRAVRPCPGRRRPSRAGRPRRPRPADLRPHPARRDRAGQPAPARGAPGHQRRGRHRGRARGGSPAGADRHQPARRSTHLSQWRMQLLERPDGLVVVNDAYNANPDSMRAALETLARMGGRSGRAHGRGARRDARARRRERRGAPRSSACSPTGSGSTSWWSSAPAPRGSTTRSWRCAARTAGRATSTPPRRPASGCARMWPVPTSCSSRPHAAGDSNGSSTCWSTGHDGEEPVS